MIKKIDCDETIEIRLAVDRTEYDNMCKEIREHEGWFIDNAPFCASRINRLLGHLDYYWNDGDA